MVKRSPGEGDTTVKKRMIKEMAGRTKCQTIENDKWRRKEYIK